MNRPAFPGHPPWWPNTLAAIGACYGSGIVIAMSFGYRWADGLNAGVVLLLVCMLFFRWRHNRWRKRFDAWREYMQRTGERLVEL